MGVADPGSSRLKLPVVKATEAQVQPMREKGWGSLGSQEARPPYLCSGSQHSQSPHGRSFSVSVLMVSKFPLYKGTSHIG